MFSLCVPVYCVNAHFYETSVLISASFMQRSCQHLITPHTPTSLITHTIPNNTLLIKLTFPFASQGHYSIDRGHTLFQHKHTHTHSYAVCTHTHAHKYLYVNTCAHKPHTHKSTNTWINAFQLLLQTYCSLSSQRCGFIHFQSLLFINIY